MHAPTQIARSTDELHLALPCDLGQLFRGAIKCKTTNIAVS